MRNQFLTQTRPPFCDPMPGTLHKRLFLLNRQNWYWWHQHHTCVRTFIIKAHIQYVELCLMTAAVIKTSVRVILSSLWIQKTAHSQHAARMLLAVPSLLNGFLKRQSARLSFWCLQTKPASNTLKRKSLKQTVVKFNLADVCFQSQEFYTALVLGRYH